MAPGLTRAHRLCVGLAVALLLLVGTSGPNAATPELAPRGWGPGALVPITLGPGAVTGVLWTAYLVGGLAVLLGLRAGVGALRTWALPVGLGGLALLTAPFGSGDHLNYLAYGRILVGGGNPWVESPIDWAGGTDPVTSRVEDPWTTEPSVYGPFGTLLHGLAALLGGDSLRQGVWVWQVLVVGAWLAVRWVLHRVLDPSAHGRVDVLWTLNPLVFGVGVLGAHIDLIAAALAVVAVWVVVARSGVVGAGLGGGVVALAGSTKFTYAVVGAGIVAAWWLVGLRWGRLLRRFVALGGGFLVVAGVLHAWAGPHVYDQLMRSRQAVSLATPWRPLLEWGRDSWGDEQIRVAISLGAAVLAVLLAWCLLRLSRPAARTWSDLLVDGGSDAVDSPSDAVAPVALWVTACLSLAFSLAAPYSLPWYDLLVWAALPALLPGLVDLVALVRLTALSIAYVPGRVLGMTPEVEELTLGVRRGVVPWVALALWLLVIGACARNGSALRRGPRRAGT